MKAMKDITSKFGLFTPVREEICSDCGTVYALYETPRGIMGACKTCNERNFLQSLQLPSLTELDGKKQENMITRFEKVPSDLVEATVNRYKPFHESQKIAKQRTIEFVQHFDKTNSLVFSGAPGLGKSHLIFSIVKALRKKGYRTMFIKTTNLLDLLKSSYRPEATFTEQQIFDLIESLDVLALDDIGSEYVKVNSDGHESWASDVLYKIFDIRIDKSILCTTNYTEKELTQKYGNNGPRIISRMMNKAKGIRLEGQDYRRREVG